MSDTIAAIATGGQIAAIGIIRLSGPESINIADRLFTPAYGKPMREQPDRKLCYGTLRSRAGDTLDICVCTVSRAPHSYTGEDTAELQCHGSPVMLRSALEEIFACGARQAGPGEFTKRAFINGRIELTAAEAVADIIDAETVESAKNAAAQLSGAMHRRIEAVYSRLADISSHFHAVLDYPDEDIEDFTLSAYVDDLEKAQLSLESLLSSFERGKTLNSGIPAALVGCPNAGKSSLLNALLGYDRAIVTAVPGTTRDTIEEKLKLGSVCLRLCDTAGIREATEEAERLGVERSRRAMEQAELVLVLVDGSRAATAEDMALIAESEGAKKAVLVLTKCDLGRCEAPETKLPTVRISSVTGEGISELQSLIEGLFPLPEVPAGEILTNARQAAAVSSALDYLKAAIDALRCGMTPDIVLTETEGAMSALGELNGRSIREDVTARIFSRFCVGK